MGNLKSKAHQGPNYNGRITLHYSRKYDLMNKTAGVENLYGQQLDHIKIATEQKWPELPDRRYAVFHQDNARTHTSVVTRRNIWELGLEILIRPPYSQELAPSDNHLYLAMQNFLSDKKLGSREDCENRLPHVFTNKYQDFYERGIMKSLLKGKKICNKAVFI
ncbi:transposase [Trichonephila clavipes]|nr:transposase [Trichonephila clavipes]